MVQHVREELWCRLKDAPATWSPHAQKELVITEGLCRSYHEIYTFPRTNAVWATLFKLKETCHIGDDLQSDFFGARNLGMDAILVDRNGNNSDEVTPTVSSFLELA